MDGCTIWIGDEPRERDAYEVARASLIAHGADARTIHPVSLASLRVRGLYWRMHLRHCEGQLYDVISDAPMSTEFAFSRFLTPALARWQGWALFMDCDVMARAPIADLFALADPRYAVMVVKHPELPGYGTKMDGQKQVPYRRKNWSSLMLFNAAHPALRMLSTYQINEAPGSYLHGFDWLADELIGEIPPEWNHLVGIYPPSPAVKLAHFTLGVPSMPGHWDSEFANEWRDAIHAPLYR